MENIDLNLIANLSYIVAAALFIFGLKMNTYLIEYNYGIGIYRKDFTGL